MATQRAESYHPSLKQVTHGKLSLKQSALQLAQRVQFIMKRLTLDEESARVNTPIGLDMHAFRYLIGSVSLKAIQLVTQEWEALVSTSNIERELLINDDCECSLFIQYSLPCRHYLLRIHQRGQSIPRSLLHPRCGYAAQLSGG